MSDLGTGGLHNPFIVLEVLQILLDDRPVVFFDIDNTLYSANSKISHVMGTKIHGLRFGLFDENEVLLRFLSLEYFVSIGLNQEDASDLHLKYYTQYGLALRGLTRHHNVGNSSSLNIPSRNLLSMNRRTRFRSQMRSITSTRRDDIL